MLIEPVQRFWRSLCHLAEIDPPHLIEFVMLLLAIAITTLAWGGHLDWEFWVLGLSLGIGAAACCLVRELLMVGAPNPTRRLLAVLMLLFGSYTLWDTVRYWI